MSKNVHSTKAMFRSGNLKLETLTFEEQRELFRYLQEEVAENLRLLAQIWAYWEKAGTIPEDMKGTVLARELPRISDGRVSAEIFLQYGSLPAYVVITTLPLSEQERLAERGSVPVRRDGGKVEEVRLSELSEPDLSRVFKDGHVIQPEKQDPPIRKYAPVQPRRRLVVELSEDDYEAVIRNAKRAGMSLPAFVVQQCVTALKAGKAARRGKADDSRPAAN